MKVIITENKVFDVIYRYFDKTFNTSCLGKTESDVVYTSLNISTMTLCFNFNQQINLKLLNRSCNFPVSSPTFK